jgi:hypothetical protein
MSNGTFTIPVFANRKIKKKQTKHQRRCGYEFRKGIIRKLKEAPPPLEVKPDPSFDEQVQNLVNKWTFFQDLRKGN